MTNSLRRLSLLALLAAACGVATNSSYRGEPLATVQGQLTASPGTAITGTVRLALAWYPRSQTAQPTHAPKSIVTEDLPYQGTFPLNYSFDIYGLPPAEALSSLAPQGGTGVAAIGLLIAYEDLNGNGQLDTIPAGGTAVDRVLGSSAGDLLSNPQPGERFYEIVYLDGTVPAGSPALNQGFNLLRLDPANSDPNSAENLPFSTSVPINLTGDPRLNILVCEGSSPPVIPNPAALGACGIPSRTDCTATNSCPKFHVSGSLGIASGGSSANLTVYDGTTALSTATVTVNGRAIPYDAAAKRYSLFDSKSPFLADGTSGGNSLKVSAPGQADLVLSVPLEGRFSLTKPAFNASIASGSAVTVSWTASAGAKEYRVRIFDQSFATIFDAKTAALSLTTGPLSYTGAATLNVEADADSISDPNGSLVFRYVNEGLPLTFVP